MEALGATNRVAGAAGPSVAAALAAAYRCLQATGRHALRGIECEMEDETLILQGTVSTFYEKQLAQAVLLNRPEITTISNKIHVAVSSPLAAVSRAKGWQ